MSSLEASQPRGVIEGSRLGILEMFHAFYYDLC